MSEHDEHHDHEHHDTTVRRDVETDMPVPTRLSWGAILAGMVVLLSLTWFLHLLGLALGVSIADVYDDTLLDDGLPQAAALWVAVSALFAYFIGSALAARCSGSPDATVGAFHGLTVWGLSTLVAVALAYCGVTSLIQTGQSVLTATASVAASAAGATGDVAAGAAQGVGQAIQSAEGTQVATQIRNKLKDRLAGSVASLDDDQQDEVSEEDVREAMNSLDDASLDRLVTLLLDNEQQSAAELIAAETDFSESEAAALIEGAYRKLERRYGDPSNDEPLSADIQERLTSESAELLALFDRSGGEEVSPNELSQAIESLSTDQMTAIVQAVWYDNLEEAKAIIADNTNLSEDQAIQLLAGVRYEYSKQIEEIEESVNAYAEAASTYASQVLWIAFAASGLGLAVSLLGGWLGAAATKELCYTVRETVNA
ncbi:MAG: hypothetical protein AAGF31_11580, partial [Planctomycetota bacterium]